MHELSIALSLLEVAAEEAERLGESGVVAIHVKLGPLAGVDREALLSAYELAREQSPLANARLIIEDVPLLLHCPICQVPQPAESVQLLACGVCGTICADVASGRELELSALEVV